MSLAVIDQLLALMLAYWLPAMLAAAVLMWGTVLVALNPKLSPSGLVGVVTFYLMAVLPILGTLGAGPLGAFVPMVVPAVIGGGLVTFALSIVTRARIPRFVLLVEALALMPVVSRLVNDQPIEMGVLLFPAAALGILVGCQWTLDQTLWHARAVLRVYIWVSLLMIVLLPGVAFLDTQSRYTFGFPQLQGVTEHPNGLATVAVLAVLTELVRRPVDRGRGYRVHLLAAAVALLLTGSRGAFLAIACALLTLAFAQRGRAAAAVVVGVLAATWVTLTESGQALTANFTAETENGRLGIWRGVIRIWEQHPWLGAGELASYWQLSGNADPGNAHNQFVQTLASNGIVGLVLLAAFMLSVWRRMSRAPYDVRPALLAILAALFARFIPETPLLFQSANPNAFVALIVFALCLAASADMAPLTEGDDAVPDHKNRAAPASQAVRRCTVWDRHPDVATRIAVLARDGERDRVAPAGPDDSDAVDRGHHNHWGGDKHVHGRRMKSGEVDQG